MCGGGGGQNIRLLFSVFSPGHFGILDRYPLCAFGVSADTLSACIYMCACASACVECGANYVAHAEALFIPSILAG